MTAILETPPFRLRTAPKDAQPMPIRAEEHWTELLGNAREASEAISTTSVAKLLASISDLDEFEKLKAVRKLLAPQHRQLRNQLMIAMLRDEHNGFRILAIAELMSVELDQLRNYLSARDLAATADDAVTFALEKFLAKVSPDSDYEVQNIRSYLRTIGLRKAVELKERLLQEIPEGADDHASYSQWEHGRPDLQTEVELEALAECQRTAISSTESKILQLFYAEEWAGREIAESLKIPPATIYKWRKQAEEKLRHCVQGKLR